jgi:hypothetical protein
VKVRYLADADFNKTVLIGILRRNPAIDFQTAFGAGLQGKKDPEVLALAAQHNRILVSHDVGSMPTHFRSFQAHQRSPGVFLIPQSIDVASAIDELLLIWSASEALEWENRLVWLPL